MVERFGIKGENARTWTRSKFMALATQQELPELRKLQTATHILYKAKNVSLAAHKTFCSEKPKTDTDADTFAQLICLHWSALPSRPIPWPFVHIICHLHGLYTQKTRSAGNRPGMLPYTRRNR